MRISDWSSDVCSSDLPDRGHRGTFSGAMSTTICRVRSMACRKRGLLRGRRVAAPQESAERHQRRDAVAEDLEGGEQRDRKSVVKGKRVSVRVDLGGRRLMKKKKKNNEKHNKSV